MRMTGNNLCFEQPFLSGFSRRKFADHRTVSGFVEIISSLMPYTSRERELGTISGYYIA